MISFEISCFSGAAPVKVRKVLTDEEAFACIPFCFSGAAPVKVRKGVDISDVDDDLLDASVGPHP